MKLSKKIFIFLIITTLMFGIFNIQNFAAGESNSDAAISVNVTQPSQSGGTAEVTFTLNFPSGIEFRGMEFTLSWTDSNMKFTGFKNVSKGQILMDAVSPETADGAVYCLTNIIEESGHYPTSYSFTASFSNACSLGYGGVILSFDTHKDDKNMNRMSLYTTAKKEGVQPEYTSGVIGVLDEHGGYKGTEPGFSMPAVVLSSGIIENLSLTNTPSSTSVLKGSSVAFKAIPSVTNGTTVTYAFTDSKLSTTKGSVIDPTTGIVKVSSTETLSSLQVRATAINSKTAPTYIYTDATVDVVASSMASAIFPRDSGWFSKSRNDRVWAADITGDGKVDFVGIANNGSIHTSINNGNFKFSAMEYSGGSGFESSGWFDTSYNRRMWTADINGDGKDDIVGINFAGNICYALSKGDGKFENLKTISGVTFPSSSGWFSTQRVDRVWPADINGDGYTDFIGMDDSGSIYTFVNKKNFTFETRKESKLNGLLYKSGWFNTSINSNIWPGDFNGDGKMDIVAIDSVGAVSYAISRGDGYFDTVKHVSSGAFPTSSGWYHTSINARVWTSDITGDGKVDFVGVAGGVYTTLGEETHSLRRLSIDGAFPEHLWFDSAINNRVWTGDIDGDGKMDMVAISDTGSIRYALSKGNGTFEDAVTVTPK